MATHSEGVIREALSDTSGNTLVIVLAQDGGLIKYAEIDTPLVLDFDCSAEICYQAFHHASHDYHNALYGYIEAEGWLPDYKNWLTTRNGGVLPEVSYIKERRDKTTFNQNVIMSEKIRHMIHHPENRHNGDISEPDLEKSISDMRTFIQSKQAPAIP